MFLEKIRCFRYLMNIFRKSIE